MGEIIMNNIQLGPGAIFCYGSDGQPFMLGEVKSVEMKTPEIETVTHELVGPMLVSRQDEISFEVNIGRKKVERFLQQVMGIDAIAFDIAVDMGYGHVVHLARKGRKRRTRKKNVRRVYKIVQKGC